MPRIRTVMVTLPKLLREIILQMAISLDLVAVLDSRENLAQRLQELAPALVVIGLGAGEQPDALRAELPDIATLALAHDRRSAWLYRRRGEREHLTDLSPAGLVAALRTI